jgi:hypothetical protein
MHNRFMAVIQLAEGIYTAYCPEISETRVEGRTKLETLAALRVKVVQILDDRCATAIANASPSAMFETICIE